MLWLSAILMVATAVTHSVLGEVRLIGPQIRERQGVMRSRQAQVVTRFAWHLTSALMVATAFTVAWPGTAPDLIRIIGAIWLAAGLADLVATRGRHVGWPALSGAGALALFGAT